MHRLASRGRLPRRQRELEARAAARPVARANVAAVRLHDRATDRQAEPGADDRALVGRRAGTCRTRAPARRRASPGPSSSTVDAHELVLVVRAMSTRVPGGRVLRRVVEQVRRTSARRASRRPAHGGRSAGSVDLDAVVAQPLLDAASAAPTRSSSDSQSRRSAICARLEPHQVEHVRDELRHLARLGLDRASRAASRVASSRSPAALRRACCSRPRSPRAAYAGRARSRRAACCAALSVSAATRAPSRLLGEPRALERERRSALRMFRAGAAAPAAARDAGSPAARPARRAADARRSSGRYSAGARRQRIGARARRAGHDRPPIARRQIGAANEPSMRRLRWDSAAGPSASGSSTTPRSRRLRRRAGPRRAPCCRRRASRRARGSSRTAARCAARARRRRASAGARCAIRFAMTSATISITTNVTMYWASATANV